MMARLVLGLFWRTILLLLLCGTMIAVGTLRFEQTPMMIYVKPTLIFGVFAALVALYEWLAKKNPLQILGGARLRLSRQEWRRLSWSLFALMASLAAVNIVVAVVASVEYWVRYKLFGVIAIIFLTEAFFAWNILSTRNREERRGR